MDKEILINATPSETRIALIESGIVQEIQIERAAHKGKVANIYKGHVVRVLPGMQAAFVEIGLDRTAFLHVSDLAVVNGQQTVDIQKYIHEGQDLLVQIIKDPLGSKGARLTTQLTLSSRYLVYLPLSNQSGISKRIDDEDKRAHLLSLVQEQMEKFGGGYIIRTAAQSIEDEKLLADIEFLRTLWRVIQSRAKDPGKNHLIHADLPLALRVLRDQITPELKKVTIDCAQLYREAIDFAERFIPSLENKITYYQEEQGIFEHYQIEAEINKALSRKVLLKSGGYLVIEQTEAMTVIDVNTGGYVGHRNVEETLLKTNLEAAQAIARHLRLRNIGGIIIIDFIDMAGEEYRQQLLVVLENALAKDYTKTTISGISSLGLVQMTRKRSRENLANILCEICPTCRGCGQVKTPQTVSYEIFREIIRLSKKILAQGFIILASQEVIDYIYQMEAVNLAELQKELAKEIKFQIEIAYTQEQYDVIIT